MSYQREITTLKIVNRGSMVLNGLLGLALIAAIYALDHAHDTVTVRIPPDLSQGATVQANTISKQDAWSFALYMSQYLNHWAKNGKTDYIHNIRALSPMLTNRYQAWLESDYQDRVNRSGIDELSGRKRVTELLPDSLYESRLVNVIQKNQAWEVTLDLRIVETVGDNEIKNTPVRYRLRVVRYPIDAESNPWGLALDGYTADPVRLDESGKETGNNKEAS